MGDRSTVVAEAAVDPQPGLGLRLDPGADRGMDAFARLGHVSRALPGGRRAYLLSHDDAMAVAPDTMDDHRKDRGTGAQRERRWRGQRMGRLTQKGNRHSVRPGNV